MRLMRCANTLALVAVLIGFGSTAHAAQTNSGRNQHEITGQLLFLTPDTMQIGTAQGIVDLKITKDSKVNSSVVQGDYVDVWYETNPSGNVVVSYTKSSKPMPSSKQMQPQSGQMGTSSSSSSSGMQGAQSSNSPQPSASQPMQGASSQPSSSGSHGMKQLPHTGSSRPLVGLVGLLALIGAVGLTLPRLRG